jgi:hypothetical protein
MKYTCETWRSRQPRVRIPRRGFRAAAWCCCLAALIAVLPGCSGSEYIVVRDHIHALRQDAASMTVLLRDSARIWLAPWCHHSCATVDSLRAYLHSDQARGSELGEMDIVRMTETARESDSLLSPGAPAIASQTPERSSVFLWGKGKKYAKDGAVTSWSGRIPASAVRSVSLDPRRYLPIANVREKMSGNYRVTLRSGSELHIDSARFQRDTSVLYLAGHTPPVKLPTEDIAEMRSEKGTLETMGTTTGGILAGGGTFGLLTAVILGSLHSGGGNGMPGVSILLLAGTTGGALLGAATAGALLRETYSFPP